MNLASAVDNARIAAVFEEIAELLEVQGESPFRIRAYRNAARTVERQASGFAARARSSCVILKATGIFQSPRSKE